MIHDPATYVLLISLEQDETLEVGRLGRCYLPRGSYLYLGSALSGLGPRLRRHFRKHKTPHWHIDYLTALCPPREAWYVLSKERLECRWCQAARDLPGARIPVPGFGASDCRCPAHLVYLPSPPSLEQFEDALGGLRLELRVADPLSFAG